MSTQTRIVARIVVILCVLAAPALLGGCKAPPLGAYPTARKIERAHGYDIWRSERAVQAEIALDFGENTAFRGTMICETTAGRVHLDLSDGTALIFDGTSAWISPASADVDLHNVQSRLVTSPYLLAAPMRLRDTGCFLKLLDDRVVDGKLVHAIKLNYETGIGDAPHDWQIIFSDPDSDRMRAMMYVFLHDGGTARCITYDDFITVKGVTLATTWRVYNWNNEQGIVGEPIGQAKLSNIKFVHPIAGTFTKPLDGRQVRTPIRIGQ